MPQVPGTYWYHGKVPILVHMYLVRVWDVYAYHKVRVRALAMAIVRTNGTKWYQLVPWYMCTYIYTCTFGTPKQRDLYVPGM